MRKDKITAILLVFFSYLCIHGQNDTIKSNENNLTENIVAQDSAMLENKIYYPEQLFSFFKKLEYLEKEKKGKINIVHIGDSHIQAGFFSGKVRTLLQEKFGNGGLGFAFPYNLAKTNGNPAVRYASNVEWNSYRNIFPVNGAQVGLSGIALSTTQKNLVIELSVKNLEYGFSKMKVFTPDNDQLYHIGITDKEVKMESSITKKITHKIKGGETLSGIANKYNTTVVDIKKLNKLKNNLIQTGKTLLIPTAQREPAKIPQSLFTSIDGKKTEDFYEFDFERELDKIYFYAGKEVDLYDLNGIVLENDKSGIVYHSIGVNGARFSDYNKYPLFFKQLKGLKPDLLVVSLGTNEAFDRMSADEFQTQVNIFVKNVKANNPDVDILLTTPPPSYFSKGKPNKVASELTNELIINGIDGKYAIWDMYYYLGATLGLQYLQDEKMLAKDLVHYTVKGYEYTGDLFFESVMQTYSKFNQTEKQGDQ